MYDADRRASNAPFGSVERGNSQAQAVDARDLRWFLPRFDSQSEPASTFALKCIPNGRYQRTQVRVDIWLTSPRLVSIRRRWWGGPIGKHRNRRLLDQHIKDERGQPGTDGAGSDHCASSIFMRMDFTGNKMRVMGN